jgi:hypothetical protein
MFKQVPPGSRPFQICALRTTLKLLSILAISAAGSAWALPISAIVPLPDAPDAAVMQKTQPSSPTDQQTAPATPQTTPKPAQPSDGNYSLQGAEHQRILGIIPEFQAVNTAGVYKPLTVGQKFNLMWKSSTDPYIFTLDAIVAGIGQAKNSNPGFGQGAEGYFKRFGASYADTFDGNFWGNAVLTVTSAKARATVPCTAPSTPPRLLSGVAATPATGGRTTQMYSGTSSRAVFQTLTIPRQIAAWVRPLPAPSRSPPKGSSGLSWKSSGRI